jgi:hypothetical protein
VNIRKQVCEKSRKKMNKKTGSIAQTRCVYYFSGLCIEKNDGKYCGKQCIKHSAYCEEHSKKYHSPDISKKNNHNKSAI